MKHPENLEIDKTDLKILSALIDDAFIPYTELAKKIFVSAGTVHVRMKKLEDMGIVKKPRMEVDYSKLGYDVTAFIGVYLEKSSLYDHVAESFEAIPEIVNLHYTTGIYSMFAKIVCRDTTHLKQVLHDKLQKIKGIQRTETFISLEENFSRPINLTEYKKEH